MADVFYFSSGKHRRALKGSPRRAKKQRFANMHPFPEHACMAARFVEPLFCPNAFSNLYAPFDQAAAVPPVERTGTVSSEIPVDNDASSTHVQLPLTRPTAIRWPRSLIAARDLPEPQRLPSFELRSLPPEDWLEPNLADPRSSFASSLMHRPASIHWSETLGDDDGLAVDDPARNYDFADFVDMWRLRAFVDDRLPPLKLDAHVSVRNWTPPDDIHPRRLRAEAVDMQGLHWQDLGADRDDALTAREMLHTSKRFLPLCRPRPDQLNWRSEIYYRFRHYHTQHRAQFSHYQLRNVLAASSRNDLLYAAGNRVIQTSLAAPRTTTTIMDLTKPATSAVPIKITCLAASPAPTFSGYRSDAVLLAGGFDGECAMLNLASESTETHTESFVTHAYNGLVTHIQAFPHRRSGVLQAAFCSNDHMLRLMDVTTQRFTNAFTYGNSLNCSALAPDGRLRVLVGDSNDTLVTDAEKGDVLLTLRNHTDHGFACAWSPNGIHLATGAQDGKVTLWDARKWSAPLHTYECVMSCARSMHFTDAGLLIAAESEDVVSVFDPRRLHQRQDVRCFGSLAGLVVLDGGAEFVVANADKTVGGLMTFNAASAGLNNGSFSEQLPPSRPADARREPWRCFSDGVAEVMV